MFWFYFLALGFTAVWRIWFDLTLDEPEREMFTFKLANMYISFWIGFGHSPALLILGKQQCFSISGSDWAKGPKFLSQTWCFFSHTEWNVSLTATEQIQKAQLKALHMSRERT